jgi:hypothetical protein
LAVSASATRRDSDAEPEALPSVDLTSSEAGSATTDAFVTMFVALCTRPLGARLLDCSTGMPRIAAEKEAACIVGMVRYDNVRV